MNQSHCFSQLFLLYLKMGQYYLFVVLAEDQKTIQFAINPHFFCQGAKIGEHSFVGNKLMNWVESLLAPGGSFYKSRVVWAGDYAKPIIDGKNLYKLASEKSDEFEAMFDTVKGPIELDDFKYIVNHSTKQYVKLTKNYDDSDFEVHPIPYLTAKGEGKDGIWSGHIISMEKEKPEGFTEYEFNHPNKPKLSFWF